MHWRSRCGEASWPYRSCERFNKFSQRPHLWSSCNSAEESTLSCTPPFPRMSLATHSMFLGLSTEPFFNWTTLHSSYSRGKCSDILMEDDPHSSRSLVRDPQTASGEHQRLLLGGGSDTADGVRVGCLSPGQLEPHVGKKGEVKRWKQFLIRGDPKRGKGHRDELTKTARPSTEAEPYMAEAKRTRVQSSRHSQHLRPRPERFLAARFFAGTREDCAVRRRLSLSTFFKPALILTSAWRKKPIGAALVRGHTKAGRTSTLHQRNLGRRVFWLLFGQAHLTLLRLHGGRLSRDDYCGSEPISTANNGICSVCIR